MKFKSLLSESESNDPSLQQQYAISHFRQRAIENGIDVFNAGQPIPEAGFWLLIGISTSSTMDLEMLDFLQAKIHGQKRFKVFLLDDCAALQDLQAFIPRVEKILQSPIVGIWADGKFLKCLEGFECRSFLTEHVQESRKH